MEGEGPWADPAASGRSTVTKTACTREGAYMAPVKGSITRKPNGPPATKLPKYLCSSSAEEQNIRLIAGFLHDNLISRRPRCHPACRARGAMTGVLARRGVDAS